MILFMTSSPCDNNVPEGVCLPCVLNAENGFVDRLEKDWQPDSRCVIICADPDNYDRNNEMAETFQSAFQYHGLTICDMKICDSRKADEAGRMVSESDVVILGGGHVPTQNEFFQRIGLPGIIKDFDGIVIGISAGTMNCAELVYAQPELPGESEDPEFRRFIPGLGLTELMILPHYQKVKDCLLDGKRLYEDITYPDSYGRRFYTLVDESYVYVKEGKTIIFGEAGLIEDGKIRQISENGGFYEV